MSVFDWSPRPSENGLADPTVPASDGLQARSYPGALRGVMAGVAAFGQDIGGALATAGSGNTYTVRTASGLREFGPGVALLVKVDRSNTGPAFLSVDGLAPRPWLNRDGLLIEEGQLRKDYYLWAIADPERSAWISDLFGGLTVGLLDTVLRAHWLSLPTDPRGIGPNAPWRNDGTLAWTSPDNPTFSIDSPAGRRLALKLLLEALPDDPRGIGPGEPWNNGGTLAVTGPDNPYFTEETLAGRRLTLKRYREALPISPDGLAPGEPWLNGETIAFVPDPTA